MRKPTQISGLLNIWINSFTGDNNDATNKRTSSNTDPFLVVAPSRIELLSNV